MNQFINNIHSVDYNITNNSISKGSCNLLPASDTPIYFGKDDELYGVCSIPKKNNRNFGVLFCYPIGEDYIKSHRFFKDLSVILLKKGMPVFKFDYLGTGDSMGDHLDWNLKIWSENVGAAARELRGRSGVCGMHIVARGLGAILAAAAMEKGLNVEKCVFVDPVISGGQYIKDLKRVHNKSIERQKRQFPFPKDKELMLHDNEINGFCLTPEFQASIAETNLTDYNVEMCGQVDTILSRDIKGFRMAYPLVQEKRRILKAITFSICGGQ